MKAYYKTILTGDMAEQAFVALRSGVYEYKLLEIADICCQEMKNALDDNAIGFGEFHDTMLNSDNNINFADCSPYPEGAVWTEYAIKFCPFCGKKIETEERERVTLRKVERKVKHTEVDYEEVELKPE